MVAEAKKVLPRPQKRLTPKIPLATRTQARNLYVLHQLGAPEVARQTGLTESQIYSLSHREGWTKVRAQIRQDSLSDSNARMQADAEEMVEAVAIKSAVLSLGTLDAAIEVMGDKNGEDSAKKLQALSVASKNYVAMYRQAKQLDASNASEGASQINVMFVGALPRSAERSTVNVTPAQSAIDVAPSAGSGAPTA